MNFGSRNSFICPKCKHEWEESLGTSDWEDGSDNYHCPKCGFEAITIDLQTDYWYEQDPSKFALQYFRLRGYDGNPKSWWAVSCYLEKFLEGNIGLVKTWNDEQWVEAYEVVKTYVDADPTYEKIRCKSCGEEQQIENCFPSNLSDSKTFTVRCPKCGKPEDRYMVPCEFVKEINNDGENGEEKEAEETTSG